jgi:hypothetical protein
MSIAATKSRKHDATKRVQLLEIATGHDRVDAAAGIIYGAKLVGLESRNVGRTIGLDPREFGDALNKPYGYAKRALESAIPMYEGAAIRIDHPKSKLDGKGARIVTENVRGALVNVGIVKNVRLCEDGLYGDLHLMKSHRDTPYILEAAERMPDKIALSHNAFGVPVLRDGRAVVEQILEVYSVDIVGDRPGTTNGLFESFEERQVMKKTIRQIVESLAANFKGRAALLEMVDDDQPIGGAMVGQMEVPVSESSTPEEQVVESLNEVISGIVRDDSLDAPAKLAKIKAILKIQDQVQGAVDATAAGGGDSGSGSGGAAMEESLQVKPSDDPRFKRLIETLHETKREVREIKTERDQLKAEASARKLLEDSGREVNEVRVRALTREASDADRKQLIESWPKKDAIDEFSVTRPRRSAPLLESEASDGKLLSGESFVKALKH